LHRVRDVEFGEDACRTWHRNGARVLALCRDLVLGILRAFGYSNIRDARQHFAARPLQGWDFSTIRFFLVYLSQPCERDVARDPARRYTDKHGKIIVFSPQRQSPTQRHINLSLKKSSRLPLLHQDPAQFDICHRRLALF
jgi:hypothetical protein